MGRIKTKLIKAKTLELIEIYPDTFTKDFNENKLKLAELVDVRSKKLRNTLAGYLVRKSK